MKGVIDRIEGGTAVILAESENKEFTVDVESLPDEAEEDVWLSLEVKGEVIVSVEIDESQTESRAESVSEKMSELESLSERGSRHERVE
jgi:hypothetical protein